MAYKPGRHKRLFVLAAVSLVIAACYMFLYFSLRGNLTAAQAEYAALTNELGTVRVVTGVLADNPFDRDIAGEKDLSRVIEELTRCGKSREINFVSLVPLEIEEDSDLQCKVLPVEIKVEAVYERLGLFLGALDDLKSALVRVRHIDIRADEKDLPGLVADITLLVYISGKKDA